MTQSKEDDLQYRRGVVLGLTFAEILLLLIFLLMLILAARLLAQRRDLDSAHHDLAAAKHQLAVLAPVFNKLRAGEPFDITREWVKLNDELAADRQTFKDNQAVLDLVAQINRESRAASVGDAAKAVVHAAQLGERVQNSAHSMFPRAKPDEAVGQLISAAEVGKAALDHGGKTDPARIIATCRQDLTTCKAQNSNLSARLGGVLPPCWVDSDGHTQYIFDAHLKEDGIWLVDNHVAGREADQAKLPISNFVFGRGVDAAAFVQAGLPLLEFSERQNCRFYVRVIDETNASSKVRYKGLLKGVEGIFYKMLES